MTMCNICFATALLLSLSACSSSPKSNKSEDPAPKGPHQIWSVSEGIQEPESAYYDRETQMVYVSNVAGNPTEKDKTGWISRLDATGKVIDTKWVTGLSAPKGMRASKGVLWVSDIDELVGIELSSGKIVQTVKVGGAKFLNDVTVGKDGEIFVSDMIGDKIYRVKDGKTSVVLSGKIAEAPNGLYFEGGDLIVAGWGTGTKPDFSTTTPGHLYRYNLKMKKKTLITQKPLGNLDGLEKISDGWLVSDWVAGKVYRVNNKGEVMEFLSGFKGAADIGWIPESKILIVPRMGDSQVTAYRLEK